MSERDTRDGAKPARSEHFWSRREVLAGLAGLLMLPGQWRLAHARPANPWRQDRAELPPRTIGLRSLGGAFRFDPPGLRVVPGDQVAWLNIGDFHTVTAFHPANAALFAGDIPTRIPVGAEPFHSGMLGLDAGSVFAYRFERTGVYDYFCQPHYSFGMVGRVVVGTRRDAHPAPAAELNDAARRALPAIDEICGARGRGFEWASRINGVLLLRATDTQDVAGPARRLGRALGEIAPADLLRPGADPEAFRDNLDAYVAGAARQDYERLVRTADELKRVLY